MQSGDDPVRNDAQPTPEASAAVKALVDARRAQEEERRKKTADEKSERRNATRRKEYADAKPKPFASLAGREEVARLRVVAEAQARHVQLMNATGAQDADHSLVKLRGREGDVVEAWKTMQLFRVATKREATNRDIADNAPKLAALGNADTRLRQANRLRGYFDKLEASGIWKKFGILDFLNKLH